MRRWWIGMGWLAVAMLGLAGASVAEDSGQARVRADLERFVRARAGDGAQSVTIELPPLSSFAIDRSRFPGELRTELSTRSKPPFRGRVPITVELHAGGELVRRGVVSPYVHIPEEVVVITRNLRRGDVLEEQDLAYTERDGARLPSDSVRAIEEALGKRMRRSLRAGQALRASQIEGVPVVERGDRVILLLERGPLKVEALGRAQESGAVGEWIRVLNVDSRREISGRVDREGIVHVAF